MKSLFQILFLNLKNNKVSSFKLGQDIRKKLRSSKIHFQTASKRKLDSFGTAATSCKKSNWTADIPISIPILTATNPWHSSATGPTKTEKAANKPTTSTATKSTSHARLPIRTAIWFGLGIIMVGANWIIV